MSQFAYASISSRILPKFGGNVLKYWLKICFGVTDYARGRWTKPHLDTVAGVTFFKECVSKSKQQVLWIRIDSPVGNVRLWLSSRIEFKFSAHS